ncbi:hypothetical protein EJB05_13460, partial [Eragrostis curvula]
MAVQQVEVIFSMGDEYVPEYVDKVALVDRLCRALGGAEKVEIEWGNHALSNRVSIVPCGHSPTTIQVCKLLLLLVLVDIQTIFQVELPELADYFTPFCFAVLFGVLEDRCAFTSGSFAMITGEVDVCEREPWLFPKKKVGLLFCLIVSFPHNFMICAFS